MVPRFDQIRRNFQSRGFTTAATLSGAVEGRPDEYRLAPATLVEAERLGWIEASPASPCPEPLAFVDGIQHFEVVGYDPPLPIVAAEVAAAVRVRSGREFRTVERAVRRFLVGRRGLVEHWASGCRGLGTLPIDGDEPQHPLKELDRIHRAIDGARALLECEVGAQARRHFQGWLVVDGVISDSEAWAEDHRTIGVSKSHVTLPFAGEELVRYLQLPAGYRTTVFKPAGWRFGPVYSWGLRLWPWEGQDLLHGLVRIEVAAGSESLDRATEISRWLLAERVPLSRPDPRWDRLLYGVASVERHLRARREA